MYERFLNTVKRNILKMHLPHFRLSIFLPLLTSRIFINVSHYLAFNISLIAEFIILALKEQEYNNLIFQ